MGQRARRNRRKRQANAPATNGHGNGAGNGGGNGAQPDRYQKYLPEWMRGSNGAPPPRPRQRRFRTSRPARPAGGYTPGKSIIGDVNVGMGDF